MSREEIYEYLKRVEELELKLTDEDKDTLQWLIFGYNECAKLLNKTERENADLKIQLLAKKCSDKDIEYKEKVKLQQRIDNVIEYIDKLEDYPMLTRYNCLELLEILRGERGF